jgi:lysophospholipase L1-like esterase
MSQTWNYIQADQSNIRYSGRIDFGNPKAPQFSYPGVSISARFSGTQIKGVFKEYGSGGPQTTNYFTVVIDGSVHKTLGLTLADTLYELATGLANQEHLITLVKRTESSVGKVTFKGFLIESTELIPFSFNQSRKIEFIGDSWTCGYGNEISTNSPNTGFHSVNEDHYAAWGSITARRLGAEYVATAISGRGIFRNNTGSTSGTIPQEYGRLHPGQSLPAWDPNRYVPDLVVIHLGTNDWFPETLTPPNMLDSASYVNAYTSFLLTLRSYYPQAKLLVAFGNSKSDWWPSGLNHLTRWRKYTQAIVAKFKTESDLNIASFELSVQNAPYGEDWHPTKATHIQMANEITPFIQNYLGWTNGAADCLGVLNGSATLDGCNRCVAGTTGLEACLTLGMEEEKNQQGVSVSGNEIQLNQFQNSEWEILDTNGRKLLQGNYSPIPLENLYQSGLYVLKIKKENELHTLRFVKP